MPDASSSVNSLFLILQTAVQLLRKVVIILVITFYVYMVAAVVIQVFGRYVFNYSIGWATETATFSQIWMVLLAAGVAMRNNLHVGVDVLVSRLPKTGRRLLISVSGLAALWFLFQAVLGSFSMIQIGLIQTSPAIGLPMWIPYLSLPVGLTYFGLELLIHLVNKLRNPDDNFHLTTETTE